MDVQTFVNQYSIYNRIQDRLIILGTARQSALIKVNCDITTYNKDTGSPRFFHNEAQYISSKGNGSDIRRTLTRDINCYLSLENASPVGEYREYIIIRGRDLELMRIKLIPKFEEVINNFDSIYQKREDGKIYVNNFLNSFMVELGNNKSLLFQPGLYKSYNEDILPCLEMYMNSNRNNMIPLFFEQMYELMYLIRTFQIYTYASTMLAYFSRPPAGTNLIDRSGNEVQTYNDIKQIDSKLYQKPKRDIFNK